MADWDYSVFWKEALAQIQKELDEQEYAMWFNFSYKSATENEITVLMPSLFYRDQVKQRYQHTIEDKLHDLTGKNISLVFEIKQKQTEDTQNTATDTRNSKKTGAQKPFTSTAETAKAPKEVAPHPQLRLDYTFDSYVIGDNNSFAANAAIAISRNPGTRYNPCLIYGGVGLGKTHLMQAIGNYLHAETGKKIIYVTAENFTNEFIQSIRDKSPQTFKNKYRHVDVLLIDDIHFLQDKKGTQEELFHTFNALYDANKQMVFTCDQPVAELKNLSDRLKSRFERGLNVDLQPPSYETRMAILRKKADSGHIQIPDEVIELVSRNVTSNVRDLEAALTKLTAYAELVGKEINIEIAQQQLKDVFASPKQSNVTIEIIQKVTAEYFGLSINDLKGKKRTNTIVYPRQLAMYIAKELTEYSTTELGNEFGGRDHTTVMYSCQKIDERIKSDPTTESTINTIMRNIKEYGFKR